MTAAAAARFGPSTNAHSTFSSSSSNPEQEQTSSKVKNSAQPRIEEMEENASELEATRFTKFKQTAGDWASKALTVVKVAATAFVFAIGLLFAGAFTGAFIGIAAGINAGFTKNGLKAPLFQENNQHN